MKCKNYLFDLTLGDEVISLYKSTPNFIQRLFTGKYAVCTNDDLETIKAILIVYKLGFIDKKEIIKDVKKMHPALVKAFNKTFNLGIE